MKQSGKCRQQWVEWPVVTAQKSADERCRWWTAIAQNDGFGVAIGEAGRDTASTKIAPARHYVGVSVGKDDHIAGKHLDRLLPHQPHVAVTPGQDVVRDQVLR